ncbi:diaminobutyrate acetyltransferase [Roseospirillum parvum]|uniref:L-2,4-diaminobutyric acid acetyltransferase n=1 Tax=Roseospirillum parvum TaxID=83401 RepID=A0A1G7WWE1_9PROT|nr:diaminobutyrate acetyltransferase [Roseospirillum parvum]SDG76224.1 L-2,4-diaminobutyric acid acetyltransferase [Roseospirillum parvum]
MSSAAAPRTHTHDATPTTRHPSQRPTSLSLRAPTREDGVAIHRLIAACPPLDTNSMYCNLLQCDHFADTCVIAERFGEPVGWISGYVPPGEPNTLFVWQVAVAEGARGLGLGRRMLGHLLNRPACAEVSHMKTTITADNQASWGLFRRFAERLGAPLSHTAHFKREAHFGGQHATEHMVTIGAFDVAALADAADRTQDNRRAA